MSLPKIHSIAWSDSEEMQADGLGMQPNQADGPLALMDKELRVWVTYPERPENKKQKKRKANKHRSPKRHLWAVLIIEGLERLDDYVYAVRLRRIDKKGERFLRIEVTNDPADQSEDALVFQLVHPRSKDLDPLEEHLVMTAARRVYAAIAATWCDGLPQDAPHSESALLTA